MRLRLRESRFAAFLLFLGSVLVCSCNACSNGNCQVADPCTSAGDCGPGLFCGNCPATGKTQPICIRGQVIQPTSIVGGLPFNKYSWLVTHNSFSILNAPPINGVPRVTFYNQEDSITNQLRNGVRGLMLDMYDFEDDVWLCHSMEGQCYNFTAFEPAINALKEVEAFLSENPTEIVTVIIEDYVHSPKGLTNLFTEAGLLKYWFPVSKMPANNEDWPTVTDMVSQNHRLLVFTSIASKEADEGIAYQWRYMVENECKYSMTSNLHNPVSHAVLVFMRFLFLMTGIHSDQIRWMLNGVGQVLKFNNPLFSPYANPKLASQQTLKVASVFQDKLTTEPR